jgi:hypothetical protein
MSIYLARMIGIYERGHTVVHHDDVGRFHPTTTDIEWIRSLAADDPPWIILSGDGRILRNKSERAALEEARLTFFCMAKAWAHMSIHEYTWKFTKIWPEIVKLSEGTTPRIFEVAGSKVDLIKTYGR